MQRLKTRPQFQAVLNGRLIAKTEHFALHSVDVSGNDPNTSPSTMSDAEKKRVALFPLPTTWIGAMAPKRWAKRAVTRNVIKRQIYTLSGEFSSDLPAAVFLIRLRREFSRNEFISAQSKSLKEAVCFELQTLLRAGCAIEPALP